MVSSTCSTRGSLKRLVEPLKPVLGLTHQATIPTGPSPTRAAPPHPSHRVSLYPQPWSTELPGPLRCSHPFAELSHPNCVPITPSKETPSSRQTLPEKPWLVYATAQATCHSKHGLAKLKLLLACPVSFSRSSILSTVLAKKPWSCP